MAVDAARAKSLFLAASDLADSAERAAYLDRECGGDADLRARVEALLRANDAAPLPVAPQATVDSAPGHPATEDHADPTARVGALLAGKYKLIEEIGEGGMGSVFMAQQTALVKRAVAVKVIKAGMDSRAVLARFEAERQALALMDHPNIARVLDAGSTDGGRPFFVMELVKGTPITRYCDEHKLTPRQRLELFVPVCQAIQHAHQKGIIHRDIKPSNVLVALYDDRTVPKVIDFGVAKAAGQALTDMTLMTGFGALVGTPEYMSPEQASLNNLDIDTRSDVYSLGVLLYELLTGTTPVDKKSLAKAALLEILRIVREVEAPRPSAKLSTIDTLPSVAANRGTEPARLSRLMKGELDWLVLKALEKDRTRRYETANGLARDIQRYLADEVVEARPPSMGYRVSKFVRRHKGQVLAASLVLLAVVCGLAAVLAVQRQANVQLGAKNAELAEQQAEVEARFQTAQKAIATFHTGVSEDFLLKNPEFTKLRTKLLKEAARFYADLEKLLAGKTDAKSRKALAAANFQLGELMDKIGDKKDALEVHRKALALRQELAAAKGADVETRLDVARSLEKVSFLLMDMGDNAGALAAAEQQRDLAEGLEAEHPIDAVRSVLARSHHSIGRVYYYTGKPAEELASDRKASAIWQKLADANPAVIEFQRGLATNHNAIGIVLVGMGKPEEALTAFRKASAIQQKLADDNPAVTEFQSDLSTTHNNIGLLLVEMGKPEGALQAHQKALAIRQRLADANPAVSEAQYLVAWSQIQIGDVLSRTGKPEQAREAYLKALAINQKLSDANPTVLGYQRDLGRAHKQLGWLLARQKRLAEAFTALDAGLAIYQKLTKADPKNTEYASLLAEGHGCRGWALIRSGQPSQAAADLRQAVEQWAKVPAPDPGDRFERSRALALLAGLGGDAKSGVTTAEAPRFADQAVASLRDAINAGWHWPNELKEPDFDPLRKRADFQKLLAEVEAKAAKKESESK
jgi:serine/threonine protein kinase/tetratricopeptide (TPR) repeat protein